MMTFEHRNFIWFGGLSASVEYLRPFLRGHHSFRHFFADSPTRVPGLETVVYATAPISEMSTAMPIISSARTVRFFAYCTQHVRDAKKDQSHTSIITMSQSTLMKIAPCKLRPTIDRIHSDIRMFCVADFIRCLQLPRLVTVHYFLAGVCLNVFETKFNKGGQSLRRMSPGSNGLRALARLNSAAHSLIVCNSTVQYQKNRIALPVGFNAGN